MDPKMYPKGSQAIKATDIETTVTSTDLVPLHDATKTNEVKYASVANIFGSAADLALGDDEELRFGDGTDIVMDYDGTNFQTIPAAADDWLIGADAANLDITLKGELVIGKDDTGHDVKFFGATASSYLLWDESADALIINAGTADLGTSCEADAYTVGGVAGIDFGSAAPALITVVKGIVTACSS